MKFNYKNMIIALMLSFITIDSIRSSDHDDSFKSGQNTPRPPRNRGQSQEEDPSSQGPSDASPVTTKKESGSIPTSQSQGFESADSVTDLFNQNGNSPSIPRQAEPRASTPPARSTTSVSLDSELDQILRDASTNNKEIVKLIQVELEALKAGQKSEVAAWQAIFRNIKDLKDSPHKLDIRKKTIVLVCKIIAKDAFWVLENACTDPAQKIKAMFQAMKDDKTLTEIILGAQKVFEKSADLTALPAWVVKCCFEKVEQFARVQQSDFQYIGLRDAIPGLPFIRSTHIGNGHVFEPSQINNVALGEAVLVDPETEAFSIVWNELIKIDDDGSPKKIAGQKEEIRKSSNIRKTIFPISLGNAESVAAYVAQVVKTSAIGTGYAANCILKLFKNTETGLTLQCCYDAGGAMISTAYPMRIMPSSVLDSRKPVCIMKKYKSMNDFNQSPSLKKRIIYPEETKLSGKEIQSYIQKSDRIIADCSDSVIVDIGHIEPLCSLLIQNNAIVQLTASPKGTPKSKKGSVVEEDEQSYMAQERRSNLAISQYCPIGVEVPLVTLESLNHILHQKVMKERRDRQVAPGVALSKSDTK